MPGVLLIESMAQTSGWLIIAITRFARMPFLAAVREAKLRTFVSPGQVLSLTASLVHEGSGFAVTKAAVEADGKTVANCEITFRVMEFPDLRFRTSMLEVAARIGFPAMPDG
jgi:3-hydroxyacyl-[acyl-carrier-protein] dehydratase